MKSYCYQVDNPTSAALKGKGAYLWVQGSGVPCEGQSHPCLTISMKKDDKSNSSFQYKAHYLPDSGDEGWIYFQAEEELVHQNRQRRGPGILYSPWNPKNLECSSPSEPKTLV